MALLCKVPSITRAMIRASPMRLCPRPRFYVRAQQSQGQSQGQEGNTELGVQQQKQPSSNLERRRDSGSSLTAPGFGMPSVRRLTNVFNEMEREMNNMLSQFGLTDFRSPGFDALLAPATAAPGITTWRPATDITETDTGYVIHADMPGLTKQDVKISLSPDNVLTLSGERKLETEEEKEGLHRFERSYGRFVRRLQLPAEVDIDSIKATVEHGVLKVTVPKSEKAKASTKEIPVE